MITGELRSKVDAVWMSVYTGGISNPLTVIEQLTYLLFIKRLDELHTVRESKANRTGKPIEHVECVLPAVDSDDWASFLSAALGAGGGIRERKRRRGASGGGPR